jgi:DNA-binding MarR family transcriptional regulator
MTADSATNGDPLAPSPQSPTAPAVCELAGAPAGACGFDTREPHHDRALLDSLDDALMRMRRTVATPPATTIPIPALGRRVDAALLMALMAIAHVSTDPRMGAVNIKDVANYLDLDHSTVSRLVGEGVTAGLVTRAVDPQDRRRATVALTEMGRAAVSHLDDTRRQVLDLLLSDWSTEDATQLVTLLTRFTTNARERLPSLVESVARQLDAADASGVAHPQTP